MKKLHRGILGRERFKPEPGEALSRDCFADGLPLRNLITSILRMDRELDTSDFSMDEVLQSLENGMGSDDEFATSSWQRMLTKVQKIHSGSPEEALEFVLAHEKIAEDCAVSIGKFRGAGAPAPIGYACSPPRPSEEVIPVLESLVKIGRLQRIIRIPLKNLLDLRLFWTHAVQYEAL